MEIIVITITKQEKSANEVSDCCEWGSQLEGHLGDI